MKQRNNSYFGKRNQQNNLYQPTIKNEGRTRGGSEIFGEIIGQERRKQINRPFQAGRNQKNTERQERLPAHVAELRSLMSEQGVLVCTFLVDSETGTLLHAVHLESRGLMLPHDGKSLHAQIVSASREFYEIALKDIPDIEPKDLNRLLKQDVEKLFRELLGRIPCVIILIHFL